LFKADGQPKDDKTHLNLGLHHLACDADLLVHEYLTVVDEAQLFVQRIRPCCLKASKRGSRQAGFLSSVREKLKLA